MIEPQSSDVKVHAKLDAMDDAKNTSAPNPEIAKNVPDILHLQDLHLQDPKVDSNPKFSQQSRQSVVLLESEEGFVAPFNLITLAASNETGGV